MQNLVFNTELLNTQEKHEFIAESGVLTGRILDIAPSDSNLLIVVDHEVDKFKIKMSLASLHLKFDIVGVARSPLVALEIAFSEATKKIKIWSLNRDQEFIF